MSLFVLYAKLFEYDFGRSSVTDNREHERLVNFFGGKVKMSNIIDLIESEGIRKDIPDFQPGDTVRVFVKVVEGNRERLQAYEGLVIARKNGGIRETFTVRRISYGVGVERTFPLHSPKIDHIEIVRYGKVRRAKLYYIRDLKGKAAKVEEIRK